MRNKIRSTFSTRQYMLSKDFEVYYYSDQHFTPTKKHTHDYYEFYFFLEGDITMYIGDKHYLLKPGDIILIPPGTPHRAVSQNPDIPYRRFIFWIGKEYYRQLCKMSEDYEYIVSYTKKWNHHVYHTSVTEYNIIQTGLFHLIEEIHSDRFGKESQIFATVISLLLQINRFVYESTTPRKSKEHTDLYENLLVYIDTHLSDDLSLDQLASVFFVSKYHIAHLFKDRLGTSCHQYILKKRLAMCCQILLSETNISKVYVFYGFKDYSSFFRAFKKEYGVSPKEYKEMYGGKTTIKL